jgi:hypothetical protein
MEKPIRKPRLVRPRSRRENNIKMYPRDRKANVTGSGPYSVAGFAVLLDT